MRIIGLDLLGCTDKKTCFCFLADDIEKIAEVDNESLVSEITSLQPDIVV